MKKSIIYLSLMMAFSASTLTTQTPPSAAAIATKTAYNWNYWSYELGLGASYIHYTGPYFSDDFNETNTDKKTITQSQTTQFPFVDFRLGIEKSWRFANNFTATIDFACLTPAVTFGYLVSPTTRLYVGTQYSVTLNLATIQSTTISETTRSILADGTEQTITNFKVNEKIKTRSPLSFLTPRLGVDHFLSPSTMLRINVSYDWRTFYDANSNQPRAGNLHWPQLTIGIKKFF